MDDNTKQQPEQPAQPHSKHHHKSKHSSKKKWVIIGAVVFVLLVAGGIGGWLLISSSQKAKAPAVITRTSDQIDRVVSDANTLADNNDTNGAKAAYDNAIKQTSDASQKATLLVGDASIFYDNGEYDQALTIAKQAEAIKLDVGLAAFIAEIYRIKGDSQNAILYYQKAIDLTDKSVPEEDHSAFYQSEIDGIKGVNN